MKIVHVCLNYNYNEGWSYQHNIITKYHKLFGHTVTMLAPTSKYANTGETIETPCEDYINADGVRIIRLKKSKSKIPRYVDFFAPYNIFPLLCELQPDMIMVHGFVGSTSAFQVRKYMKRINRNCRAVVDIHQDAYNSPINKSLKRKALATVHRILNSRMYPFYEKIFFVAPSCRNYAAEYYHAPIDKMELLPLSCDPEYIDLAHKDAIRAEVRARYDIGDGDIVLCHGGKFEDAKKTVELVQAFQMLSSEFENIKLVLFGTFCSDYESQVFPEGKPAGVIYVGMLTATEYYRIYQASDLAVFPGGQSVLWQQAIACGVATVFPNLPHTQYLNLGGNAAFFEDNTVDAIHKKIYEILAQQDYIQMGRVAMEKGTAFFSYDRIAQRVIDVAMGKE